VVLEEIARRDVDGDLDVAPGVEPRSRLTDGVGEHNERDVEASHQRRRREPLEPDGPWGITMRRGLFRSVVITLFTRPLCAMCAVVTHWLQQLRIVYREIDITTVPEARRIVRGLTRGELSVPVVVLEDGRVLVEPTHEALFQALRQHSR